MIVTLTANPSLDRTITVGGPLVPGGVHRIGADSVQLGGKGINVALGLHRAGIQALALAPADPGDPFLALLEESAIEHRTSPLGGAVRTNLTVVSSPEVTTKINEPGTALGPDQIDALEELLRDAVPARGSAMLSGSLAPGLPAPWYARAVRSLHERGAWVGVDTSDAPLSALAEAWQEDPSAAPDLLTPNAEELGQLTGLDGERIESAAEHGELEPVREAALALRRQGIGAVLVTLGGAGAVLAAADGCWWCPAERGPVLSTVGAGDSAAAGYLIGRDRGESEPERLARAVAYGTAAVGLPGTTIPRPDQVRPRPAAVRAL